MMTPSPSVAVSVSMSEHVDAVCRLYTEKMRRVHEMLDREEDARERTARQTAAGRALWAHVIHDHLAGMLAGEASLRRLCEKMMMPESLDGGPRGTAGVMLAVRTLWFDRMIEAAVRQCRDSFPHRPPQVILLGAGMDTRAYRLKCLEGCHVYEVDLPKVLDAKAALLLEQQQEAEEEEEEEEEAGGRGEKCREMYAAKVERVAADLATDEWWQKLRDVGFSDGGSSNRDDEICEEEEKEEGRWSSRSCSTTPIPAPITSSTTSTSSSSSSSSTSSNSSSSSSSSRSRSSDTVWVLEGLLYYLREEEACAVLRRIACGSASGTRLVADLLNESSTQLLGLELQAPFFFHSDWPEELLPTLGFDHVHVSQVGDPDANFGLIGDSPTHFFNRLRGTPRYSKSDAEGNPCRRMFLVECSVSPRQSRHMCTTTLSHAQNS